MAMFIHSRIQACFTLCYTFIYFVSLRVGLTFFIFTLSCFYSTPVEGIVYLFVCSNSVYLVALRTRNKSTTFHSQSPALTWFMRQGVFLTLDRS
jgi:hypothetical protein